MHLHYSHVIEKYSVPLGTTLDMVEDAFNKPDKSDILGGTYISIKFYNGFLILITFYMKDNDVFFENAYKIFPNMVSVDVEKASALDILENFMQSFGMEVDVPKIGRYKIFKDVQQRIFFQGILDIEKYNAALKK